MSTSGASGAASSPKTKRAMSVSTTGESTKKTAGGSEEPSTRKKKSEEELGGSKKPKEVTGVKEDGEKLKKKKREAGEAAKANGHGSESDSTGGGMDGGSSSGGGSKPKLTKKASRSANKAKLAALEEGEEDPAPETTTTATTTTTTTTVSSKDKKDKKDKHKHKAQHDHDEQAASTDDSHDDAHANASSSPATAKKPAVPPKPTVHHDDEEGNGKKSAKPEGTSKPVPPKKHEPAPAKDSSSSDEASEESHERGSGEASTISDDSSSEAAAPVVAKAPPVKPPRPSTTSPTTTSPSASPSTERVDKASRRSTPKMPPQAEVPSDDDSESPEPRASTETDPPSTASSEPKRGAKPTSSSKPTGTAAPANAVASTSSHSAGTGSTGGKDRDGKDKDKKKHGGILSFFKGGKDKEKDKDKKKHGDAKPSREGGGGGHRDSGHKDNGHKDGTPEKRRDEEKKTYVASCVAELPDEWQKKLKKTHLAEDTLNAHFYILCNVLHFLTKDSFRMPDQEKEVRERRPYASQQMMDDAKLLFETTDNIKRFYKNIEFSGKGGFGRVFAAKDITSKKRVAIKKLPHVSDKDKKNNYCEISFLSTCNHPNIVKFMKAWEFADKQEAWIVTEFLEGGTLSEAVKVHQFTERHIAYVAREILKALKYLHSLGYIHRDLKSGNVMMSIEGQIKLIDFGLCCDTTEGERLQMLGSPYWIPPEMIKKKRHGCPADIWSFAVCVLEMYLKEPPNCDSRLYAMFTAASAGLKSAIPSRASDNARDFLSRCLEINPKKRWTAEQLLEHPFVTAPKLEEGIRDVLRGVFVSNSLALSGI